MNSVHNWEQELFAPWDDGTCIQHQTYSHQSSYRTDIQVGQVFLETHFPSVLHKVQQELNQLGMMKTFLDLQCQVFHFGVSQYSIGQLQVSVVGPLRMMNQSAPK